MSKTRMPLIAVLAFSVLISGSAAPASAQAVDTFEIAYGDTVSDGVPAPGAGNLEAGGSVDVYTFAATAGDAVILDALVGATVSFRWRLEGPGGDVVFDTAYVDRPAELAETGTYSLTVYGTSPTVVGTYSFRLLAVPPAQHFAIAFGDTVSDGVPDAGAGNIESPGAVDVYSFEGQVGQTVVLDALSGPTSGLRSILTAPDGTELLNVIFADQEVVLPETGTYTLTVQGLTVTGVGTYSFQLLERPTNGDPVAVDDAAETDHGVPVVVDVLANDSDPDGDSLGVEAVTQPTHGTASTDGTHVTYDPDPAFSGSDAFTYTVSDGKGGLAEATVSVTVHQPVNSPPTIAAVPDQESTVGDDVTLLLEASDPDGDSLTYSADGLPPGLALDAGSGEVTGTIEAGADAASPYAVVVTVTDPAGASATAEFSWVAHPADTGAVEVEVDILLPCLFVNGFGTIPVLVHGNDRIDGAQIDLATVELEGMPVMRLWRHYLAVVDDVNGDGIDDLFVLIRDTGEVQRSAESATLTGALRDGTTFSGSDDVCTSGEHS